MISRLGSPEAMTVLAVIGAVFLGWRREGILLAGWIAAFIGTTVIDNWLKVTVHRARPVYASAILRHPTWSFPSGHAMGALVGYGMLSYVLILLLQPSRRARTLIVAGAAVLVLAIGASRLYLGVHYFSDVVGGYVAGLLWLGTCIFAIERGRRWRPMPRLNPNT